MIRKSVGVLIGLLVFGVMILSVGSAGAACPSDCELFWSPVTTYTDNTAIEPQDLPLKYVAEWDGNLLPSTVNTFVPVPKPYGHGIQHTGRVKAITARGKEGSFSGPFGWNSPEGIPRPPDLPGFGVR